MPDPNDSLRPGEPLPTTRRDAIAERKPRARMTPETTLGTALLAYAGLNGLAGLFMLTFPRALWVTIGGADAFFDRAYASTRFAGAALVTLAVAALLVIRKPSRQSTLVTVLALEATLVAVATLVNAVADDVPTDLWFEWLIALGSIALAAFLWWARIVARKALKES